MAVCAVCRQLLVVEIDPDDSSDDVDMDEAAASSSSAVQYITSVPDDVHLPCGCHLHWECLLDSYEYTKCASCNTNIVSISSTMPLAEQITVNLHNEGGRQSAIDILPILKEESYLRAYPEERKCRAFLEFCREGDHRAIVDLLQSCGEEPEYDEDDDHVEEAPPSKTADEVLRYQDPIGDMASGLHAAVANGHREVAWLLLLLASQLSETECPALVSQEAAALGIVREDQKGLVDIRGLKDSRGRTSEDVAREVGVVWNGWIGNGRLATP